jgi:hypothetical protein
MNYTIKAHETWYADVLFRSRLEATWAAFFDLVGWSWEYEPLDLPGWTPDFRLTITHRSASRVLLVEIKPYYSTGDFKGHPLMRYITGTGVPATISAGFGNNPSVTTVPFLFKSCVRGDIEYLWKRALNATRYDPKGTRNPSYRLKYFSPLKRLLKSLKLHWLL